MTTRERWYSNPLKEEVAGTIPFNDYYSDSCEDEYSWDDIYDDEQEIEEKIEAYYNSGTRFNKGKNLNWLPHHKSIWCIDKIRNLPFKINESTEFLQNRRPCIKALTEPVGDVLILHKKGRVSFTTKTTYVEAHFQGPIRQEVVIVNENGNQLTRWTNQVQVSKSNKRFVKKKGIHNTRPRKKRILRKSGTGERIGTNIEGVPGEIHILDPKNTFIDWDLYFLNCYGEEGLPDLYWNKDHYRKGHRELCHLVQLASSSETPEHKWDRLKKDYIKFPKDTHYTSEIFRGLIECQGNFKDFYTNFVPNRRPQKIQTSRDD
jgi:hypothetical protein